MSYKNKYGKLSIAAVLVGGLLWGGCSDSSNSSEIYGGYDNEDWNVLQEQDSIAVRAILDANGLQKTEVIQAVLLENSEVTEIDLKSMSLSKFVFCKYIDSLLTDPKLNLIHNNIDTLLFPDTIAKNLQIMLDDNKLKTIPDGMGHLKGNVKLFVGFNEIQSLAPDIMNCSISYIYLNENKLCSPPDSILEWIKKINPSTFWQSTQTCQ
jgi:hypothetical protein